MKYKIAVGIVAILQLHFRLPHNSHPSSNRINGGSHAWPKTNVRLLSSRFPRTKLVGTNSTINCLRNLNGTKTVLRGWLAYSTATLTKFRRNYIRQSATLVSHNIMWSNRLRKQNGFTTAPLLKLVGIH